MMAFDEQSQNHIVQPQVARRASTCSSRTSVQSSASIEGGPFFLEFAHCSRHCLFSVFLKPLESISVRFDS